MEESELLSDYNYDAFVPEKFERWMNWDANPPLGRRAPDFPLWDLDGSETHLGKVWSSNSKMETHATDACVSTRAHIIIWRTFSNGLTSSEHGSRNAPSRMFVE